jgi:hypothetical protein
MMKMFLKFMAKKVSILKLELLVVKIKILIQLKMVKTLYSMIINLKRMSLPQIKEIKG